MKVKLFLLRETDLARQYCTTIKVGGGQPPRPTSPCFWLPKSEITYHKKTLEGVLPVCELKIPDWLGNKYKLEGLS